MFCLLLILSGFREFIEWLNMSGSDENLAQDSCQKFKTKFGWKLKIIV